MPFEYQKGSCTCAANGYVKKSQYYSFKNKRQCERTIQYSFDIFVNPYSSEPDRAFHMGASSSVKLTKSRRTSAKALIYRAQRSLCTCQIAMTASFSLIPNEMNSWNVHLHPRFSSTRKDQIPLKSGQRIIQSALLTWSAIFRPVRPSEKGCEGVPLLCLRYHCSTMRSRRPAISPVLFSG